MRHVAYYARSVGALGCRWCTTGLPAEGGGHLNLPLEDDPSSRAAQLRRKRETPPLSVESLPNVSSHFREKRKVYAETAPDEPSDLTLSPVRVNGLQRTFLNAVKRDIGHEVRKAKEASRVAEVKTLVARSKTLTVDQMQKLSEVPLPMRLKNVLARVGLCSTAKPDPILHGRVRVNGEVVLDPGMMVLPADRITCGAQPVLVDYPRIWRYCKASRDKGFIEHITGLGAEAVGRIQGVPDNCCVVSPLPASAHGLVLMTTDRALATYLERSPDIEREWEVLVIGEVKADILKRLNSGFSYQGTNYKNMLWAVASFKRRGYISPKDPWRGVVLTRLQVRSWGPHPMLKYVLQGVGLHFRSMKRTRFGPYDLTQILPGEAREALIDDEMMQFTDSRWDAWVKEHSPMLNTLATDTLERRVATRKDGASGTELLHEALQQVEDASMKHKMQLRQRATPIGTDLAEYDAQERKQIKRRQKVGRGVPREAAMDPREARRALESPPLVSGV